MNSCAANCIRWTSSTIGSAPRQSGTTDPVGVYASCVPPIWCTRPVVVPRFPYIPLCVPSWPTARQRPRYG